LFKFGAEFDHTTAEVLYKFKLTGSKVKVTAWGNDDENSLNYQ